MARIPGLTWRPIARKQRGSMPRPVRVNLHVAVSEASSLHGFFNRGGNPDSHAYVLKNGSGEQYVDTSQHAYADLQGNSDTISVETQGGVRNAQSEPWTAAQLETLARIVAWAHTEHGIPLRLATDSRPGSSSHGLSWHRLGIDGNFPSSGLLRGRVSGGLKYSNARGKVCPGDAKIRQIPAILDRAKEIVAGGGKTPVVSKPTPTAPSTSKSISQMASEVIAGHHGNGHANRRRSLGVSASVYEQVRAEVNRRAGVSTPSRPAAPSRPVGKSVSQMATEVINGQHGNGHASRRKSLGVDAAVYEQVRAEVNRRAGITTTAPSRAPAGKSISQMATEVLRGDHGNGHANRRRSLGISQATYERVRAEVNRRA